MHAPVGNKSLGESISVLSLAGSLESPTFVSTNNDIYSVNDSNNIRIPVTNVLLCAAVGNLSISKKKRYWVALNSMIIPKFLTEATILDGETSAEKLLRVFVSKSQINQQRRKSTSWRRKKSTKLQVKETRQRTRAKISPNRTSIC